VETDSWRSSECLLCFSCGAVCPKEAIHYRWQFPWGERITGIDLQRRRILQASAAGLLTAAVLAVEPRRKTLHPLLIRPPGAVDEERFGALCIRCGSCLKVCPTNGLQPTLREAGWGGLWTPILVPRLGYCEYNCTLCGQVCPSGAIRRLNLTEKRREVIGEAWIDRHRCLPYAAAKSCIVCEEHCPTSPKAIWFQEMPVATRDGKKVLLKQPVVDLQYCIGCGVCETKCPVGPPAAIRVFRRGATPLNAAYA